MRKQTAFIHLKKHLQTLIHSVAICTLKVGLKNKHSENKTIKYVHTVSEEANIFAVCSTCFKGV